MDFAELNDVNLRFTDVNKRERNNAINSFEVNLSNIIRRAEYEHSTSASSMSGTLLKAVPLVGGFAVVLDKARDVYKQETKRDFIYGGDLVLKEATVAFSKFVEEIRDSNLTLKSVLLEFRAKMRALNMTILEKDQRITSLEEELEKMKDLMKQENEQVIVTLNTHPQVNETIRKPYANSIPWLRLSTEQQTICRLVLEIQKLNGELRISKVAITHWQNKHKNLQKKYDQKIILESDFDEMVDDNIYLEEENTRLKKEIETLREKNKKDFEKYRVALEEMKIQKEKAKTKTNFSWFPFLNFTMFQDLWEVFNFFRDFEKFITLFFYNICLITCIFQFADSFNKRGMMYKLVGFFYFPIILALLYLIAKRVGEKRMV